MDLTAKEHEQRFAELFRYAQVGLCVNGVAHDINNLLGAIMAYAELVELDEGLQDESKRMLGELLGAIEKCADLVSVLTSVARPNKPSPAICDPCVLAQEVLELRGYAVRTAGLELETTIPEGAPSITLDSPKVKLALVYLLMNAQEAAVEQEDKTVHFAMTSTPEGIEFSIRNAGMDFSAEETAALMRPFGSEKTGPHLGYGLHAAKEIAELHAGNLRYEAARGFVLFLASDNELDPNT